MSEWNKTPVATTIRVVVVKDGEEFEDSYPSSTTVKDAIDASMTKHSVKHADAERTSDGTPVTMSDGSRTLAEVGEINIIQSDVPHR